MTQTLKQAKNGARIQMEMMGCGEQEIEENMKKIERNYKERGAKKEDKKKDKKMCLKCFYEVYHKSGMKLFIAWAFFYAMFVGFLSSYFGDREGVIIGTIITPFIFFVFYKIFGKKIPCHHERVLVGKRAKKKHKIAELIGNIVAYIFIAIVTLIILGLLFYLLSVLLIPFIIYAAIGFALAVGAIIAIWLLVDVVIFHSD